MTDIFSVILHSVLISLMHGLRIYLGS